ncbi:hypothetical protein FQA47_016029 [Oryzias melastigma]|uniref:Uncharacterized protein n=1 Tax=Oryzias melastigma TaxID=30732 RepID=A0A834FNA7_ORYME|nr:hypothetical protein FQA47_016029 [Oryzias melastigma]
MTASADRGDAICERVSLTHAKRRTHHRGRCKEEQNILTALLFNAVIYNIAAFPLADQPRRTQTFNPSAWEQIQESAGEVKRGCCPGACWITANVLSGGFLLNSSAALLLWKPEAAGGAAHTKANKQAQEERRTPPPPHRSFTFRATPPCDG